MRFLCLAYGDEAGWNPLSEEDKQDAHSHDQVIRERGTLMSAVRPAVTSVRNRDKQLVIRDEAYARHDLPLAGFSVIEAVSLDDVIKLVSNTPCARGVIEIRPFWQSTNSQ